MIKLSDVLGMDVGTLEDLFPISHVKADLLYYNPLLTRDQEPQWVECSAPKVGMLQRHMANCLKDKIHIHTTLRWGRAPGKPSLAGAFWAHAGESPLLSRSGGEKGLRASGAGTLGVPLGGTRRVGGLLGKESAQGCIPKRLLGRPD